MAHAVCLRALERWCLALFMISAAVVSVRAHCGCYGVRNAVDNDGGWQLYTSDEPDGCLICFFGMPGRREAELVLPCWDQNQKRISRFNVSYIFHRAGGGGGSMSLRFQSSNTTCEMNANYYQLHRNTSTVSVDQRIEQTIAINVGHHDHSYNLKASRVNPNSFYCLKDVKYFPAPTSAGRTPSPTTACTRVTTVSPTTFLVPTPSLTTASTRVTTVSSTTFLVPTPFLTTASTRVTTVSPTTFLVPTPSLTTASTRVTTVSVTDHTTTTTSIHSSPKGNQNTALEQRQSKFPIWMIFVIIAIVISICAIAVVVFRRRKQHDHQQANNVNTGRVNDKSNLRMDNMKNDKDVIANPTYGQEPVIGKEEEYHSYTEIDVKIPDNSEMIYNSAYESTPASSDMVYNSAYESQTVTSDMVYNSAYESSPSN